MFMPRVVVALLLATCSLHLVSPAQAQFEQLAAKVPSTANAIVLLDGQKLLASPLAAKEGWTEKYAEAFAAGLVTISPDTQRMVIAAEIDFAHQKPLWELALGDFGVNRSVAEIARRTKGPIDEVGGLQAVVLRDDSYCVQFSPSRLGVFAPSNRQAVARWLREVQSRSEPGLSPYLEATLVASQTSQIVVALDLQDAVPPEVLRAGLSGSSARADAKIDLEAATKAAASLRGVVLEVAVTDGSFGRLMVHFGADASVLAPIAKPLILEVLGNQGAMIDDIANWKVTTEANKFTLNGPLGPEGRRRVLSLIDHPVSALIASDPSKVQSSQPESSKEAYATLQYFKSIEKMRDELREMAKDVKTFGQHAMWLDKWARKIDRLPALNVDQEMLNYGRYTTTRMRDAATALRGIGINTGARTAQVGAVYSTGYSVDYWGNYWSGYDSGGQRRAIGAEERAAGATSARGIAAEMENESAKIRQAMTSKYKINF
jgi:hypothetical protein